MIALYHVNGEYSISLEYLRKYLVLNHPDLKLNDNEGPFGRYGHAEYADTIVYHTTPEQAELDHLHKMGVTTIHHLDFFPTVHNKLDYIDLSPTELIYMKRMLTCKDEQTRNLAKKTLSMVPIDFFPFFYSRNMQENVQGTYMFNFTHQILRMEMINRSIAHKSVKDTDRINILLDMFPNKTDVIRKALEMSGGNNSN